MMEQRFRERAKRSGGGPISTGEIDARVQDEMQQFFSESHDKLEQVVPGLTEEDNHGIKETTGEIRRKIDDFFAQVIPDEGGDSPFGTEPSRQAPPRSAPEPSPPTGEMLTSPRFRSGPQRPFSAAQPGANSSGGPPPRPAGFSPGPATPSFRPHSAPQSGPAQTARERPTLDLKTALEKLRRTGSAGEEDPSDSVPRRPEPLRRRDQSPPSEPAQQAFHARVAPPEQQYVQPEPVHAPPPPTPQPEHQRFGPRPAVPAPAPESRRPSEDLPPELDRFAYRAESPPAWTPPASSSPPTRGLPPPPSAGPERRDRVELSQPDAPVEPITARIRAARSLAPPPKSKQPAPSSRRPSRKDRPAPAEEQPAKGRDTVGNFDEIFSEVQNLVLDSLKGSVAESFTAAHDMSQEISEEISQRVSQRISDVAVRAAESARARSHGTPEPQAGPERGPSRRSASPSPAVDPRSSRRSAARDEFLDEEEHDEPSAFGSPDIRPAARALSSVLPAPSDEDELEEQAEEAMPSGPYDWGVKKKQQARGAWLLDAEDTPVPATSAPEPEVPAARETPEAPEPDAGGGAGARGYLQRKLGQEVENLGPALEALERRAVLTARETAAIRGRAEDTDDLDAEVSVDSFVDDRPRNEGDAMTPMKLVEQLRTVRRLQELLIEKGLIDPSDLERSPDE